MGTCKILAAPGRAAKRLSGRADIIPSMSFLVFLDTSFLMEFKPIREIAWKELLETSGDIVITIAPIVTKELNEHKHGKDARKRDRARRATTEIERLSQGQQIEGRPGLSFDLFG